MKHSPQHQSARPQADRPTGRTILAPHLVLTAAALCLSGCISVSAGGAVVGTKATVSGNTVETDTTVRSATVGVSLPPPTGQPQ